ncbi:MAG: RNA 2',3'-cyclic phosphodiesterase [Pseudomonadota bacterium]
MRLFFALQPDPATCLAIAAWRDNTLPPLDAPVSAANFHITLAFLGEIKERQLDALCGATDELAQQSVTVSLDQLGYWSKPGILWIGPSTSPQTLTELARSLRQAGRRVHAPAKQSPFQPHLTLARRCQTPPPVSAVAPSFNLSFEHFVLFVSERSRSGLRYTRVAEWPLT